MGINKPYLEGNGFLNKNLLALGQVYFFTLLKNQGRLT